MIAYQMIDGRAANLRFVAEDYQPEPDEVVMTGDALPPIESLHDPAVALAERKAQACARIDGAAEAARLRYITGGAGQAMAYQQKAAEADAYVAADRPADTSPFPVLEGEAAGRGISVDTLADEVRATRNAWAKLAGAIEGIRKPGKDAVMAAADLDAVELAEAAALIALEGI